MGFPSFPSEALSVVVNGRQNITEDRAMARRILLGWGRITVRAGVSKEFGFKDDAEMFLSTQSLP